MWCWTSEGLPNTRNGHEKSTAKEVKQKTKPRKVNPGPYE